MVGSSSIESDLSRLHAIASTNSAPRYFERDKSPLSLSAERHPPVFDFGSFHELFGTEANNGDGKVSFVEVKLPAPGIT